MPSVRSVELKLNVTFAAGSDVSTTLKVVCPPASVVGCAPTITRTPALSSSMLNTLTAAGVIAAYAASLLIVEPKLTSKR